MYIFSSSDTCLYLSFLYIKKNNIAQAMQGNRGEAEKVILKVVLFFQTFDWLTRVKFINHALIINHCIQDIENKSWF